MTTTIGIHLSRSKYFPDRVPELGAHFRFVTDVHPEPYAEVGLNLDGNSVVTYIHAGADAEKLAGLLEELAASLRKSSAFLELGAATPSSMGKLLESGPTPMLLWAASAALGLPPPEDWDK